MLTEKESGKKQKEKHFDLRKKSNYSRTQIFFLLHYWIVRISQASSDRKLYITLSLRRCHDTRRNVTEHNDSQDNDTQHTDTENNDTQYNDTQHNDTQHTGTEYNDTQHNDTQHEGLIYYTQHK